MIGRRSWEEVAMDLEKMPSHRTTTSLLLRRVCKGSLVDACRHCPFADLLAAPSTCAAHAAATLEQLA